MIADLIPRYCTASLSYTHTHTGFLGPPTPDWTEWPDTLIDAEADRTDVMREVDRVSVPGVWQQQKELF